MQILGLVARELMQMKLLEHLRLRKHIRDTDSIWEEWDYAPPIISGVPQDMQPKDWRLRDIVAQVYHGWFYCQKAVIELSLIHPHTDYKPVIDNEFREYFRARREERQPMPLTIYEKDGQLIMSDDYEAYWLYRECEVTVAHCIIIGRFTKVPGVEVYGKPFTLEKPKAAEWETSYNTQHDSTA